MTTDAGLPNWVVEAAAMPIAFAQVREDSLLDVSLLEHIGGDNLRGILIASGGCSAAMIAASARVSHLHLVDLNPSQIALSRLKLHLLQTAAPLERAQILGHAPMSARFASLAVILQSLDLPTDALGPPRLVADIGPDHAGRYELLFAQLRAQMQEFAHRWAVILNLTDAKARAGSIDPQTQLGHAMDEAFDRVLALPHLVRLFGAEATQNSVQPFSRHFACRTRHAIATSQTATNPYLWQMLLGRFPEGVAYPWLSAPPPARMPLVTYRIGVFDDALAASPGYFDFVHLSNILDWLAPEQARRTLDLAWKALRPGGFAFIRQLNSTLALPALGPAFEWLVHDADALHRRDRSFFYRCLHLGRKR